MSSSKTSGEGQMGSGESDDEFYNVKLSSTQSLNDTEKEEVKKVYSPQRTKVKYDYKFDSSSDDDSDDPSRRKNTRTKLKPSGAADCTEKTKDSDKARLPENTSKVVEKINNELKNMKNGSGKVKIDKSDVNSVKHPPAPSVGVPSPVVVVPPPMIVPQAHPVMAMGPTGMIVPSAIGLANQNVMISSANLLNLQGNVIRGTNSLGGAVLSPGLIQNQGNVLGMTNDMGLGLMGLTAPTNMMQMPGLCMAGIPVQGALRTNLMGIPGASGNLMTNQALMNTQGSLLANPSNVMTNPGGVMLNHANVMTVTNMINNQMGAVGNPGNLMLNINNLNNSLNYPGNILKAQAVNRAGVNVDIVKQKLSSQVKKCEEDGRTNDKTSNKTKSPSPIAKESKNWEENDENDDDDDDDEEEEDETSSQDSSKNTVRETANTFKNDGSFMEIFKKMNEAKNNKASLKKMPDASDKRKDEWKLSTVPYDPRFPNTNQTRHCYQSYVDFYRCQKKRGEDYEPCNYFRKAFLALCPNSWISNWDSQREEGTFPTKI